MNARRIAGLVLVTASVLTPLATDSCAPATDDRQAPNGTRADFYDDATNVTVYRNADDVPNVATFCLGTYGWAATLSGGDSGADKTAVLVRFPELDAKCKA